MRSVAGKPKTMTYSWTSRFNGNQWNPPKDYTFSGSYSYVPYTWTRSDITKVPYNDGWRAPTAYVSTELIHQPTIFEIVRKDDPTWTYLRKDSAPYWEWNPPSLPGSDSSLQSLLVMKALASVKDEKINLAVTLAEMRSTIDMIRKRASKFAKAFAFAKRGKWKQAYDTLGIGHNYKQGRRDLATGWLEIIYGWLPLLADVKGGIDEVNRKVNAEGYTIVGRAKSEKISASTATRKGFIRWGDGVNIETVYRSNVTQKVALWYRLDLPNLQRAAAVGITNPLAILWELTLFSFLVDWWASVGDWLSSLDATIGLEYMGGTHTYYCEMVSEKQTIIAAGGRMKYTPGVHSVKTMDRKVIKDSPDDKLVFTNPLSTSHAITAVALTITSLKTR